MDIAITKTLGEAIWRRAQAEAAQYERAQPLLVRLRRGVGPVLGAAVRGARDSVCLTAVVAFWLLLGDPLVFQGWLHHLAGDSQADPSRWVQWGLLTLTGVFWVLLFLIRWLGALLRPRPVHDVLALQMALGQLAVASDSTDSSKGSRS